MAKRRHNAKWFLALACLVILVCMTQRMAGMHVLQMKLSENATLSASAGGDRAEAPIIPCELSAKSLLMSPPLIFEAVILGLGLLLTVLALLRATPQPPPPARAFPSPVLRIHLKNCVFRE